MTRNNIIKSAILSATMVPNPFSKGIFSYLAMTVALETSPALGMAKLTKYPIKTAKTLLINLGL